MHAWPFGFVDRRARFTANAWDINMCQSTNAPTRKVGWVHCKTEVDKALSLSVTLHPFFFIYIFLYTMYRWERLRGRRKMNRIPPTVDTYSRNLTTMCVGVIRSTCEISGGKNQKWQTFLKNVFLILLNQAEKENRQMAPFWFLLGQPTHGRV